MGEAGPQRERTFLGVVHLLGPVSPTTTDFLIAESELTLTLAKIAMDFLVATNRYSARRTAAAVQEGYDTVSSGEVCDRTSGPIVTATKAVGTASPSARLPSRMELSFATKVAISCFSKESAMVGRAE